MRRTYADVDAAVLERTGNRSEATAVMRGFWINDALLRVSGKFLHPEMQGVTTETGYLGQDTLTSTTADIFAPRVVKRYNGQIIHPVTHIEEIESIGTKTTGIPSRFYWWGNQYTFDRFLGENTIFRIWYRKKPLEWTVHFAPLNEQYDYIIESYAIHNALNYFREYEKAQLAAGQADQYARDQNLPLWDERQNDWNAGIQVRMR